jgi:F-type H+-transporting ATPase subunit b
MTIDWWTLGLQTVNVLVLVWILARFLFKPVAKIIAERQEAAQDALDEAEAARAEAQAAERRTGRAGQNHRDPRRPAGEGAGGADAEKRKRLDAARAKPKPPGPRHGASSPGCARPAPRR